MCIRDSTQTVLEEIGYHLDEAHTDLYRALRDSCMPGPEIPHAISARLNIQEIIHNSAKMCIRDRDELLLK